MEIDSPFIGIYQGVYFLKTIFINDFHLCLVFGRQRRWATSLNSLRQLLNRLELTYVVNLSDLLSSCIFSRDSLRHNSRKP